MNRRRAGLSVALIGVALVVGLALRPDDAKQGPATRQEPAPADVAAPFVSSTPSEAPPEPPLPRSLRGTEEDGALVVDSAGRFVPTPDAIDLFDYYLAAAGEEPWAVTASRIRAAIARRLSGAAAQDAERLLDQYLAYRSEASALVTGRDVGQDFARRLQLLRELRREIFGASTARVLFGEEETRWFADLERRRILTDASRSPEDAAAALAAIEASEPAEVTASRASSRAHAALRADEARLRAEGASADDLTRLRQRRFGVEAAARLAVLDGRRASWERRVDAYRVERARRLAGTDEADRAAILDAVRTAHFPDPAERRRVAVLDRGGRRGAAD